MIIVYTNIESQNIANRVEEYLKGQGVDAIFVKTLSKSFVMKNGKIQEAFGKEELLKNTCKYLLQGEINNSIIKNLSSEILKEIYNNNIKIKQNAQKNTINKFVLEFNQLKKDGDLIDYIINIIVENLKELNEGFLQNKCFNLLNNSDFINEVGNSIIIYKKK